MEKVIQVQGSHHFLEGETPDDLASLSHRELLDRPEAGLEGLQLGLNEGLGAWKGKILYPADGDGSGMQTVGEMGLLD